jgi:hypothetical protein
LPTLLQAVATAETASQADEAPSHFFTPSHELILWIFLPPLLFAVPWNVHQQKEAENHHHLEVL